MQRKPSHHAPPPTSTGKSLKVAIVHGPNLHLLGTREPSIYGHTSFDVHLKALKKQYPLLNIAYFQSNIEGVLIDYLCQADADCDGIVLNAGAYAHTSLALADTVRAITTPVLEVHISNTYAREAYRQHSYLSAVAAGIIVGFGMKGYRLALEYFVDS